MLLNIIYWLLVKFYTNYGLFSDLIREIVIPFLINYKILFQWMFEILHNTLFIYIYHVECRYHQCAIFQWMIIFSCVMLAVNWYHWTWGIFSLILFDIYLTQNCYTSVLRKIDQLTFSAAPPFGPVLFNYSLTGLKLGRKKSACLWMGGINNY